MILSGSIVAGVTLRIVLIVWLANGRRASAAAKITAKDVLRKAMSALVEFSVVGVVIPTHEDDISGIGQVTKD